MSDVVRLGGPGARRATPFLREKLGYLQMPTERGCLVDLACGNGRNSEYAKALGYAEVVSLDMQPDYPGAQSWKAGQRIPRRAGTVDVVLCQYMLMFLSDQEIAEVLDEVHRVLKPGGYLLVELQEVKRGRAVRLRRVLEYLRGRSRWYAAIVLHEQRCIIRECL